MEPEKIVMGKKYRCIFNYVSVGAVFSEFDSILE